MDIHLDSFHLIGHCYHGYVVMVIVIMDIMDRISAVKFSVLFMSDNNVLDVI